MNHFLAILSGVIVAVMISINGILGQQYGDYTATVIIHLIGLLIITVVMVIRRNKFRIGKRLPVYMFLGGVVGIVNTVGNIVTVNRLGVVLTLALGLIGQLVISALIDWFGWFGVPKKQLRWNQWVGILIISAGTAMMILL